MFVTCSVLPIEKVYSGEARLELPWFQRAYAWSEMHVGRLVHDLLEAQGGPRRRYSLGHVSLARAAGAASASIIDGHQRSISLTMLLALLRDLSDGDAGSRPIADRLHALIETSEGLRLLPQPGIAGFFKTYVQTRGATLADPGGDIMDLSPSERNILANRDHMRSELENALTSPEAKTAFARFVLEDCILLVDEVEEEEEARDLMRREEETGLSPHSSELAKVTILTAMPSAEQEEAAALFESAQNMLSADNMSHLLAHIRLLKARRRSSRAVDGELIQRFKLNKTGLPFLKDELLPRAIAMAQLNRREIGDGEVLLATARTLEMLFWLDHQLWVPAALHWLAAKTAGHPQTPLFFARLDRISYLMKIASIDPTEQERRFLELLDAIDEFNDVEAMKPLQVERRLLNGALENLRSRTFYAKRFHALVLRRISVHIDATRDPGVVDGDQVTVEHVLPRKPDATQQWLRDFKNKDDVADHCHRTGNLAFLTQKDNDNVGNSDFMLKRFVLAQSGSRFILSAKASEETAWTRETIMRRGEAMITLLLEPWQLKP